LYRYLATKYDASVVRIPKNLRRQFEAKARRQKKFVTTGVDSPVVFGQRVCGRDCVAAGIRWSGGIEVCGGGAEE
jgi:hypothetical protein